MLVNKTNKGLRNRRLFCAHTYKGESMSAHGDYEDLCQFLACQNIKQVKKLFLVHGEYEVQQAFRQRLMKKGFDDVEIPEMHSEVGLG